MEISWICYPVLLIALFFFFFNPARLYDLLVFSIPFTGTGLLYILLDPANNDGFWFTPSMILGPLCLLRHLISVLHKMKIRVPFKARTPLIFLFLLAGICVFSLSIPAFIDIDIGHRDDYYQVMSSFQSRLYYFNLHHLTRTLYFVFGCFMAYYFAIKNNTYTKVIRSVRVYIYASLFIACWGAVEFILFYMDIPYPSFLLSQVTEAANHQETPMLFNRPRITSATMEPSVMSQQLLTAVPLLFFQIKNWKSHTHQVDLKIYLIIITIVLAFSTATTAVVGLTIFLLILGYERLKKGLNIYIFRLLAFMSFVALSFIAYELYQKLVTTYSGNDRMESIEHGLIWFFHYPILGVGWGVLQIFDLFIALTTHLGLVGLFAFLSLLLTLYMNFRKLRLNHQQTLIREGLQYSLVILLMVSELSGFVYYHQYFWLVLGLAIAGSALHSSGSAHTVVNQPSKL